MQLLGNWELYIKFTSVACILFLLENVLRCFHFWKFRHWNHFLFWIFTFRKKSNLGMNARDVNGVGKRILKCLFHTRNYPASLLPSPSDEGNLLPILSQKRAQAPNGTEQGFKRSGFRLHSCSFLHTRVNRLLLERAWLIQHFRLCGPHHRNYSTPLLCHRDSNM